MSLIDQINEYMPVKKQDHPEILRRTRYRMKAYIITLHNHHDSTVSMRRCLQSIYKNNCNLEPLVFPAITPDNLKTTMDRVFGGDPIFQPKYTYPTEGEKFDMRSGLKLTAYKGKNLQRRIACFMSHYLLWLNCLKNQEEIMILEQDAVFTRKFEYNRLKKAMPKQNDMIIALNDPIGATRKAAFFHKQVVANYDKNGKKRPDFISGIPWIDDQMIPQGLPGNSAYIINPAAAKKLIDLTAEYGIWPNDAMMCKQLMPNVLKICYPYYTKVMPGQSTTSDMI